MSRGRDDARAEHPRDRRRTLRQPRADARGDQAGQAAGGPAVRRRHGADGLPPDPHDGVHAAGVRVGGHDEEEAQRAFGSDKLDVFHLQYDTLEQSFLQRADKKGMPVENQCYSKIIAMREAPRRILGAHILGPNSGEIIQGLALSMKLGATKDDLEAFVPIHPTHGEEVFNLSVTKEQNRFAVKRSC